MRKITLYSLSTCPACRRVRNFLDENSIEYSVIEVDTLEGSEQWVAAKELSKYNPAASYPTVLVTEAVVGADIETLRRKIL